MNFKNERLMMSKEEARNRAKELLNENQVDLITKYMFLEQQCKKQKEVIDRKKYLLIEQGAELKELYSEIDKLQGRIDKAIEYIEYEMPYLQETDKEYEDINGHTYYTYKEYDGKELIEILKEVE